MSKSYHYDATGRLRKRRRPHKGYSTVKVGAAFVGVLLILLALLPFALLLPRTPGSGSWTPPSS